MRTVIINNSKLVSKNFWVSLTKMLNCDGFAGTTNFKLFKIKKLLIAELEIVRDSLDGADMESVRSVMKLDFKFETDLDLDIEKLAEHLNANDLQQVEVLFS